MYVGAFETGKIFNTEQDYVFELVLTSQTEKAFDFSDHTVRVMQRVLHLVGIQSSLDVRTETTGEPDAD